MIVNGVTDINRKEVMEGLSSRKSPGSAGIGTEFYKVYKKEIA